VEPSQLLIPAVLGAGAVATGLARRHQARRLATLLDARSTSVAELRDLQATVAEQLGAGCFRERVKLSGELVCTDPLTAPWSGEPCVAFTNYHHGTAGGARGAHQHRQRGQQHNGGELGAARGNPGATGAALPFCPAAMRLEPAGDP